MIRGFEGDFVTRARVCHAVVYRGLELAVRIE